MIIVKVNEEISWLTEIKKRGNVFLIFFIIIYFVCIFFFMFSHETKHDGFLSSFYYIFRQNFNFIAVLNVSQSKWLIFFCWVFTCARRRHHHRRTNDYWWLFDHFINIFIIIMLNCKFFLVPLVVDNDIFIGVRLFQIMVMKKKWTSCLAFRKIFLYFVLLCDNLTWQFLFFCFAKKVWKKMLWKPI